LDLWARDYYQDHFSDILSGSEGFFDRRALESLLSRYRAGNVVDYGLVWRLFSFQSWHRAWTSR
jgi:hypothetical protein